MDRCLSDLPCLALGQPTGSTCFIFTLLVARKRKGEWILHGGTRHGFIVVSLVRFLYENILSGTEEKHYVT